MWISLQGNHGSFQKQSKGNNGNMHIFNTFMSYHGSNITGGPSPVVADATTLVLVEDVPTSPVLGAEVEASQG